MKLKSFKEKNKKQIGIILFTIFSVLLITGVILYKTFAIFETNNLFNVVNETIEDEGNIRFMVYVNNELQKSVPDKSSGYSLDTSESYCENGSLVSWNDESWSVEIKNVSTTKTKCYLYFKKIYQESILNGAIPTLGNGRLIPIQILEEQPTGITIQNMNGSYGGKVVKADITKNWYSYENQQWANAVILKDGVEDHYKPDEEIPESAIESYFVWIPRYRYVLQDSEETFNSYSSTTDLGAQTDIKSVYDAMKQINQVGNKAENYGIEIEFGSKEKGISTTLLSKGSSIVHPAFTSFNSNGMWVGKFETGYNQNSDGSVMPTDRWSTEGSQKNEQASTKVIIKPNIYSWRAIQVANAFYTSYEYQRDLESHMMKNTEWGAVAYLTQSKYGRCDENNQNCSKVRINNNENYVTGYSANFESTCGYTATNEECNKYESVDLTKDGTYGYSYYNPNSVVASTTGNYYGVFDMAGGAWEYVMGVMQAGASDARPTTGPDATNNSGFKGPYSNNNENEKIDGFVWPSNKYYDIYEYSTSQQEYQRGKLGDATKEFGPFYSVKFVDNNKPIRYVGSYNAEGAYFVANHSPWFRRGGLFTDGTDTGVNDFERTNGDKGNTSSFRIVLMM